MSDVLHPELLGLPSRVEGERVVLRPFARGDGRALFAAIDGSSAHLRPWLPWVDHHRSERDSEAYARRAAGQWMTREDLTVAILEPGGRIVGGSGLHRIDWAARSFEIGYWLAVDAVGRGYATETSALLAALAFARLGARRVEIRCRADNHRSAAVPRRLGFALEGRAPGDAENLVFALSPEPFRQLGWAGPALERVRRADAEA